MTDIAPNTLGFRDARGQVGRLRYYINVGGGTLAHSVALSDAIRSQLVLLTNAALVSSVGLDGNVLNPNQYGANAEYPNVEDKARLSFIMSNNTLSHMDIPAPKLSMFLVDGETVDPAQVAALTAALAVTGAGGEFPSTKNGAAYIAFVGGMRRRARFQRKMTIWTLNPAETGPDE